MHGIHTFEMYPDDDVTVKVIDGRPCLWLGDNVRIYATEEQLNEIGDVIDEWFESQVIPRPARPVVVQVGPRAYAVEQGDEVFSKDGKPVIFDDEASAGLVAAIYEPIPIVAEAATGGSISEVMEEWGRLADPKIVAEMIAERDDLAASYVVPVDAIDDGLDPMEELRHSVGF
jgi:hypothetical protein